MGRGFERRCSRIPWWCLLGAFLVGAGSCPITKNVGFTSPNKNSQGAIQLDNVNSQAAATLASELPRVDGSGQALEPVKVLEWQYRYSWQVDGRQVFSEWRSLGTNPDGSARCALTVKPSDVPQIVSDAQAHEVRHITCVTRARYTIGSEITPTPHPGPTPAPTATPVKSLVVGEAGNQPSLGEPAAATSENYMVLPIPIVIGE